MKKLNPILDYKTLSPILDYKKREIKYGTRAEAQIEAERTFDAFMLWTKRVVGWSVAFLLVVVVGCNSGVETGDPATGSQIQRRAIFMNFKCKKITIFSSYHLYKMEQLLIYVHVLHILALHGRRCDQILCFLPFHNPRIVLF